MTEPGFEQSTVVNLLQHDLNRLAEAALGVSQDLTHEAEQRIDAVTRLTKRLELTQLAVSVSMGISLGLLIIAMVIR